jgi:hypothetical protein
MKKEYKSDMDLSTLTLSVTPRRGFVRFYFREFSVCNLL